MSDVCCLCGMEPENVGVQYQKFPKWDDDGGADYDIRNGFGANYCEQCLKAQKKAYFDEFGEGCWCQYGQCPACGHLCRIGDEVEPNMTGLSNRVTDEDGYWWDENWLCPKCGAQFVEHDGV